MKAERSRNSVYLVELLVVVSFLVGFFLSFLREREARVKQTFC